MKNSKYAIFYIFFALLQAQKDYQNKTIYRMVYLVLLVYPNQPLIEGKDTIIKLNVLCNVLCVNYQMGWILVLSISYMVWHNYL